MLLTRILKNRALSLFKPLSINPAIQAKIYYKPKSYFSQYGTSTADFGGNFQDSKSWATLNNWDSFQKYIAGLEEVPSNQVYFLVFFIYKRTNLHLFDQTYTDSGCADCERCVAGPGLEVFGKYGGAA
jgi:hypothetical protein